MVQHPSLQHLAIIMDGNRRWAKSHAVPVLYQDDSQNAVFETISFCKERKIGHLSLFALSIENLENRDQALLDRLFSVLYEQCTNNKEHWVKQNVRVRFIGMRERLPEKLQGALSDLEQATVQATGLQLNILLAYGGQHEVAAACSAIAKQVVAGDLEVDAITPAAIGEHLWTAHAPAPDLIVRTSGVSRLSNFLLYQAAYSELLFVDYYWPEMNKARLADCVTHFESVARNFGK